MKTLLTTAVLLLLGICPISASEPDQTSPSHECTHEKGADHECPHGDHDASMTSSTEDHAAGHDDGSHGGGHSSRISDVALPLQLDAVPKRPRPPVELGEPFLGTGTLHPGFELPTGAVWQPSLLAFGTFRTAVQSFEPEASDNSRISEWANRLDLFFNLQLSGSERLVVGLRALDEDGRFTSYAFEHPDEEIEGSFEEELSGQIDTLFFEGDFGEIFPHLDREDFGSTDYGFSIGRQSMTFQGGMLIGDSIDGFGLTRNSLLPRNTSNFRATLFYGWDNLNASAAQERDAELWALLTSTDFRASTVDIDLAWVRADDDSGDLFSAGLTSVQRIGHFNTSFRILGSSALDDETTVSTDGFLLFSEISWTPHGNHDYAYVTTFAAFDEYSPAARGAGAAADGPLGPAGINFASVGLGSYGAPLSSQARDVVGGAFGYQKFFGIRRQLLFEVGARLGIEDTISDAYAATLRYQTALRQHYVLVLDGFVGYRELEDAVPYGGRLELVVKF